MISSQPSERIFGKNKNGRERILLDKRTMKAEAHEKMSGKVILS